MVDVTGLNLDCPHLEPLARPECPEVMLSERDHPPARLLPRPSDRVGRRAEVYRDPVVRELEMHRVVEVHVRYQNPVKIRLGVLQVRPLEPILAVEGRNPRHQVEMEVVLQAGPALPGLQPFREVLVLELEGLPKVEEDPRVPVLEQYLVPADLSRAAI